MIVPDEAMEILPPSPAGRRRLVTVPEGMRLSEVVATVLPGAGEADLSLVRVTLVGGAGMVPVERALWHRVRPRQGVRVLVQVTAGKDALRTILQILVLVVAVVLAWYFGAALGTAMGISTVAAQGIIMAGVSAVGNLLISALVPLPKPDGPEKRRFLVSSIANQARPGAPYPVLYGERRVWPVMLAPPITEVVGDQQYVRGLSCLGIGPLEISDLQFGDTPVAEYGDDAVFEVRQGLPGDTVPTLYPEQVIEEAINVELTYAKPQDDFGEPIDGSEPVEKEEVRTSATDVSALCVILAWPAGLVDYDKKGKRRSESVPLRIRARAVGTEDWTVVAEFTVTASTQQPFVRAHRWAVPVRGPAYDVGVTTYHETGTEGTASYRTVWAALQSIRPERPDNCPVPLALIAWRIKATAQLNGQIEALNVKAVRICRDWDAETETWVTRPTRSPAAAALFAMTGPHARRPIDDADIDLTAFAVWSEWCSAKGLVYDRWVDEEVSSREQRQEIAGAGRARVRWDGRRWRVAIDRADLPVVDMLTPLNSRGFEWSRPYTSFPDAFRVPFEDRSNKWRKAERLVPWPGHEGDMVVTEELRLPGIDDPARVWIEARRRQHELMHRPDQIRVIQDGQIRIAEQGDRVHLVAPTLSSVQASARVTGVRGRLVTLDRPVVIGEGAHAARWIRVTDADPIGTSRVNTVATGAGETSALVLALADPLPAEGDVLAIGPAGQETLDCVVRGIEMGERGAQILHLVALAPEIEALTDAEVPPAWTGRVGSPIGSVTTAPAVPLIRRIATEDDGTVTIEVRAGAGSTATVGSYRLRYRLAAGPGPWLTLTVPVAAGAVRISGLGLGTAIQITLQAISIYQIEGPEGPILSYTVGDDLDPVPAVTAVTVRRAAGAWTVTWTLAADPDEIVDAVEIRAASGTHSDYFTLPVIATGALVSPWTSAEPPSDGGTFTFGLAAKSGTRYGAPLLAVVGGLPLTAIGLDDGRVLVDDDGAWISGE